jgi:hypothetical protein
MKTKLWRQGDVYFECIDRLPKGKKTKRENGVVAYGEVTGHSHALAIEDHEIAAVYEIEGQEDLYLQVSRSGIAIQKGGATFVHQEHLPVTLPSGNYRVWQQREFDYTMDRIRRVLD